MRMGKQKGRSQQAGAGERVNRSRIAGALGKAHRRDRFNLRASTRAPEDRVRQPFRA